MTAGKELSLEIQSLIDHLSQEATETRDNRNLEDALEYYNSILKIQSDNRAAWENKCSVLNELGYYDKNITACDEALKRIGDNALILKHKGFALNLLGFYKDALAACDAAIRIDPTYVGAWTSKSYALGYLGYYEQALEATDKALSLEPEDETALINKAWTLNNLRRHEDALVAIKKALKYHPDSINALEHECKILLIDLNKKQEALTACEEALKRDDQKIELWNLKARIFFSLEEFEKARDAAMRSLDREMNPDACILYGKSSIHLGSDQGLEDGLSALEWVLNVNPKSDEAWIWKGIGSLRLGRNEDALKASSKAVEINPDPNIKFMAYIINSEAMFNQNRFLDSILESAKALDLDPEDFKALLLQGKAYSGLGEYPRAAEIFTQLLQKDGRSVDAWLEKGHALYGLGRLDDALIAFNEVIELDKSNIEAWNWKGKALADRISAEKSIITKENFNEAFQCWEESIKINPQNPVALIFKGTKLEELGEYKEANECYAAADKIVPENARISRQMGRVEGIIETEAHYKDSLKKYRTELLDGSKRLVSDTTTYLSGLLRDFRIGLNMVMVMFVIQFFVGIFLLTASLYYSAIGVIEIGSTILGVVGGLGLIVSMMILSPMKLQKNRVDFSQWMMAYSNWSNTFFAVNDLYARKALGEDKGLKWEDIKSLHDDLYKLTENTIVMVEKNCEFSGEKEPATEQK
jgi:tetratricopeptide (TPR) repeat protein